MAAVGAVIPVVPVPLVATVFVAAGAPLSELELKARVHRRMGELEAAGARVYIPRRDLDYAMVVGLRLSRHLAISRDGLYTAEPAELNVLSYYANSIAHLPREAGGGGGNPRRASVFENGMARARPPRGLDSTASTELRPQLHGGDEQP